MKDEPGCFLIGLSVVLPILGFLAAFVLMLTGKPKSAGILACISFVATIGFMIYNSL